MPKLRDALVGLDDDEDYALERRKRHARKMLRDNLAALYPDLKPRAARAKLRTEGPDVPGDEKGMFDKVTQAAGRGVGGAFDAFMKWQSIPEAVVEGMSKTLAGEPEPPRRNIGMGGLFTGKPGYSEDELQTWRDQGYEALQEQRVPTPPLSRTESLLGAAFAPIMEIPGQYAAGVAVGEPLQGLKAGVQRTARAVGMGALGAYSPELRQEAETGAEPPPSMGQRVSDEYGSGDPATGEAIDTLAGLFGAVAGGAGLQKVAKAKAAKADAIEKKAAFERNLDAEAEQAKATAQAQEAEAAATARAQEVLAAAERDANINFGVEDARPNAPPPEPFRPEPAVSAFEPSPGVKPEPAAAGFPDARMRLGEMLGRAQADIGARGEWRGAPPPPVRGGGAAAMRAALLERLQASELPGAPPAARRKPAPDLTAAGKLTHEAALRAAIERGPEIEAPPPGGGVTMGSLFGGLGDMGARPRPRAAAPPAPPQDAYAPIRDRAIAEGVRTKEQAAAWVEREFAHRSTAFRLAAVEKIWSDATPTTAGASQPADGYVRLWRYEAGPSSPSTPLPAWVSEGIPKDVSGRWWATTREGVDWYAKDHGGKGRVVFQDVPKQVADAAAQDPAVARWSRHPGEVFLPKEYVGKGIPSGGGQPPPPLPSPDAPVDPLAAKLGAAMKEVVGKRLEQNEKIHELRQMQASRIRDVRKRAQGPEALREALGAIRGTAEKVEYQGVGHLFTAAERAEMFARVQNHPGLGQFDWLNAGVALKSVLEGGRVTRPKEIALLGKVFGKELADVLAAGRRARELPQPGWVVRALNFHRAILTGFDNSFMGRQGLGVFFLSARDMPAAFRALAKTIWSPEAYDAFAAEVRANRYARQHLAGEGFFADMGKQWGRHEEALMGAKDVELVLRKLPVVGDLLARGYAATARANVAYLNQYRLSAYTRMAKEWEAAGQTFADNPTLYRGTSELVNVGSGRGRLPKILEASSPLVNAVAFSARLASSRLSLVNPLWWKGLPGPVRVKALKMAAGAIATNLLIAEMWKAGGGTAETDPNSADWLKLRHGKFRQDLLGGHQQAARLVYRLFSGQIKTDRGTLPVSRWDILSTFASNKAAPWVGLVRKVLESSGSIPTTLERLQGSPPTSKEAALMVAENVAPMLLSEAAQAVAEYGPVGIAVAVPGYLGFGTQIYGENVPPDVVARTPAENAMYVMGVQTAPREQMPEAVKEKRVLRQRLESKLRAGERGAVEDELGDALESGALTPGEVESMIGRSKLDYWTVRFKGLPLAEQESVFAKARPGEQAKWRPILEHKRVANRADKRADQERLWKRERIGRPLTPAEQSQLARDKVTLQKDRTRKRLAENAARLARARLDERPTP
jgi:hypothetical protein